MAAFTINPPNSPLVNSSGLVTPEWYRFFANLQRILGDDIITAIQRGPFIAYDVSSALLEERVLTGSTNVTVSVGANLVTLDLSDTLVVPGIYGNSANVAAFDVDEKGRLRGATNIAISPTSIGAALAATTMTAGAGLTGGGDLSDNRTFNVGAGTGIIVNANDVAINSGYIASGTYTPTVSGLSNMDAATVSGLFKYSRIGAIVSGSGYVNIDPTAAGVAGFALSLPIASNFGSATDAGGVCATLTEQGFVYSDPATDTLVVNFTAIGTTTHSMSVMFWYEII